MQPPVPVEPQRAASPRDPRARPWLVGALLLAAMVPASLYCARQLRVTNAITHFLPSGEGRLLAEVSRHMASSRLTRSIVIALSGAQPASLRDASVGLCAQLTQDARFESVRNAVPQSAPKEVYELYFPRRAYLLRDRPEQEIPALFSDSGLAAAAHALRSELGKPTGSFVRQLATDDPLLVFPGLLARLDAMRSPGLATQDGVFMTADGKQAIVFAATRASAFDTPAQRAAFAAIEQAFAKQQRALGAALRMSVSGVGRFAIRAEHDIQADITRISVISTVAVMLVFILFFGDLRSLLLGLLPIVVGLLAATTVCIAWFGPLHGLTLAFGASIIGVCEDYPVHLLNHHALSAPGQSPFGSLRHVTAALSVGALTTIAGISGLAWTSLPGVRELAAFSAIGIGVALLTTLIIVPHYMLASGHTTWLQRSSAVQMGRFMRWFLAQRAVPYVVLAALGVTIALGAMRLRFVDRMDRLVPAPADLMREDQALRQVVGSFDASRFVVAVGRDLEEALVHNDAAAERLSEAANAGELSAFKSLHSLLPSQALQTRNRLALAAVPDARERLLRALEHEGFERSAFEHSSFFDAPSVPALSFAALNTTPLRELAQGFVVDLGERKAVVTLLRGVSNPKRLVARLGGLPGVHFFDQRQFLDELYRFYRERTMQLLVAGLLVVCLIVFVRYRRLRPTLAAVVPAVAAAVATLCVLALCNVELNLLHVIATLLVLGLGVDYGVFLVEAAEYDHELGSTALSVVVACITTVLSFGLLALSAVPAVCALGQVLGLGTLLSLVLSPMGLLWREPAPKPSERGA